MFAVSASRLSHASIGTGATTDGISSPCKNSVTVQRGDTFNGIAARLGVSPKVLHEANPKIKDPNWIFPGQEIKIPSGQKTALPEDTQVTQNSVVVQRGDTFNGIAARLGVSPKVLHEANPKIININRIFLGQEINIPTPVAVSENNLGMHDKKASTRPQTVDNNTSHNGVTSTTETPQVKTALGDFREMAPRIMKDLMKDLDLTVEDAAAILGNLGHESEGFGAMQEKKPSKGRGGYGWAQWTGPRRISFENYCKKNGLAESKAKCNTPFFGVLLLWKTLVSSPIIALAMMPPS